MRATFIAAFPFIVLLAGCGVLKTVKLIKQGDVVPETFTTTVPIVERMGLMVVKVRIHGADYDFLLDSGAPNAITKELAASLGLASQVTQEVGDSQGAKDDLGFVVLDSVGIGDITFVNTGAAVVDLLAVSELACFHVSGLIGANLMRKAVWEIDYADRLVTIASEPSRLSIPAQARKVAFWTDVVGTPKFDVVFSGRKQKGMEVDFGSNGGLSMDRGVYQNLIKDGALGPTARGTGAGSISLYGQAESDSLIQTKVSRITFGEIELGNKVVSVKGGRDPSVLLGMAFFKNFRTILDWKGKTLYLVPIGDYKGSGLSGFGLEPMYREKQLVVGSLMSGSQAEKAGLALGDRIVEWNGKDRTTMTADDWCVMLGSTLREKTDTVRITVLRGEERLPFQLVKEVFIPE